jgi:cytochrome c
MIRGRAVIRGTPSAPQATPIPSRGKSCASSPRAEGGYDIPSGNLFKPGHARHPSEVYVMGNRQSVPHLGAIRRPATSYWARSVPTPDTRIPKRGPTGTRRGQPGPRGPASSAGPISSATTSRTPRSTTSPARSSYDANAARDAARKAGKPESEWPAKPQPWLAADFKPEFYDPAHPVNDSPNNTGIQDLPPAQPAFIWYPPSPSSRFPVVGSGGRTAMAGPVVLLRPEAEVRHASCPRQFDHTLFIYEWSRNWIIAVKLDEQGQHREGRQRQADDGPLHAATTLIQRPMDIELGPDGCLYVIEYGKEWGNNKDTKILRLEHIPGAANCSRTPGLPFARPPSRPATGQGKAAFLLVPTTKARSCSVQQLKPTQTAVA